VINWEAEHARCPQGHTSVKRTPGRDVSGDAVVRSRFAKAPGGACPPQQACPWVKEAPHQLTVRPQAHHEAIQAARQRQETAVFKTPYALPAVPLVPSPEAAEFSGLLRPVYHFLQHLYNTFTEPL